MRALADIIMDISIHALRVEGPRVVFFMILVFFFLFPGVRGGGPRRWRVSDPACRYFYPRPPGGGRLRVYETVTTDREISIHALRVEGDMTK